MGTTIQYLDFTYLSYNYIITTDYRPPCLYNISSYINYIRISVYLLRKEFTKL
jgi:hypothetical protein